MYIWLGIFHVWSDSIMVPFQLPTSSGRSEDIFVTRTTPRATGGCWPPWSISTRTGSRVMAGNCGSSTQELPVIPTVQGWHFWNSGRVFWIFLMFLSWWGWSGRMSCSFYFCVPLGCQLFVFFHGLVRREESEGQRGCTSVSGPPRGPPSHAHTQCGLHRGIWCYHLVH